MKLKLKQVKEVSAVDQFMAVMDFLNAMGYNTSKLTMLNVSQLKYDIIKAIEGCEDLDVSNYF
jgi:hypothetical protein